jgi:hypothetical protein
MSLLERLKKGTDNKKIIKYPGTQEKIQLHPLSEGERQSAHFAAEDHFKQNGIEISMATVDAYESEKTLQMLYLAIRDMKGKPLAPTADEFRSQVTIDEKNALVDDYLALEKECAPNQEVMTDVELETLFEEIKKKPETLGSFSNIGIARQLISYLANRQQTSLSDSGSIS